MSRPNTRSKNKRYRENDVEDPSYETLRKIHLTGEISESDIRQLYLLWKPVCQGCRVNSKDSPNCFCGLIPPSNGSRKTGLWQKISDLILSLGPNPFRDFRPSFETPAGLTNLGATCYANSILQCLYMNISFRTGIFSVEPEILKQHPVLDQLARLFSQLHSSKMAFIDSDPFIKTLELDNGVQQDSHEFLTLFLSLLERSLSHSKASFVKTMVQDLFRGSLSHVTRCSACGKESDASSKTEDFYELELNINGLSNLDESLDDYLSDEELHGENQYFCETCQRRVDATRCIKLQSLPQLINFHLKRYVFLPKTTMKKKITSAFCFPRLLDMGRRASDSQKSNLFYELSAILIHKGTAANSGHYVARIKDGNNGQWWEFDDERVLKLGNHPFEDSSNSSLNHAPSLNVDCGKAKSVVNGSNDSVDQLDFSSCNEIFSSTDAYMLMYNCVNKMEKGYLTDKVNVKDCILPLHLSEEINNLNTSYQNAYEEYELKKDKQIAEIEDRRQEVKSVLSDAPVSTSEQEYFWIHTEWLRQWADNITPLGLDNNPIQCSHGKVPVSKIMTMKRVSKVAWEKLLAKYGGGPALSNNDCCIECLQEGARSAVSADDYRERRASMRILAEASVAGNLPDGFSYYVSKTWLLQWLRRRNADVPTEADAGPTASLVCPHGNLFPEQASGAKRILVPESLWLFLVESARLVKPDDYMGCSSFSEDSAPCEICFKELTQVASLEDSIRAAKLSQRQNHEKLIAGKSFTLETGCSYYLVPSLWLMKWRTYITATGKNLSSEKPENLQVVIRSLVCQKHQRLLERPLELIFKRDTISQKISHTDGLTLIPQNDWKLFCLEWGVPEDVGLRAEINFLNNIPDRPAGSCKEMPISIEESNCMTDEAIDDDDLDARKPFIKTFPEICEECIGERESCDLVRKLNYCDEDICVYLVRGREVPRSILEASAGVSEPDRRTSRRSRKSSFGNSINLKVSGSTSIYQLKMMIWEAFGVVKENQKLHKGSVVIEDDLATLADRNIFPGDVLWVLDSEIHENRDIADELSNEQKMETKQQLEEGFRGSLLTSSSLGP